MSFWRRQKEKVVSAPVEGAAKAMTGKKRKVLPIEVKLLAMDAVEAGPTSANQPQPPANSHRNEAEERVGLFLPRKVYQLRKALLHANVQAG